MNNRRRSLIHALLLLPLFLAVLVLTPLEAGAGDGGIRAQRLTFPVTLSDGSACTMVGYLYYQRSYRHKTLQVAIHGGNYNHSYWDIPTINGDGYSYARYMAREDHAVLAIDQVGTGESCKPDGDFVTIQEAALGVHQVLTGLRSGANPLGYAFGCIVLVGHSFGSHTATLAQGLYNDADALVLTGATHAAYVPPIPQELIAEMLQYPYFLMPAAARADLFYHLPETDPDVLAYDAAALGDVLARGFVLSILPYTADPSVTHVDDVTSPVLVQLGEQDLIAPASLAAEEELAWTSASDLTVQVIEDIGHDFNGHTTHEESWEAIDEWIEETVGCP